MTNTGDSRAEHHEHGDFVQDDAIDLRDLFGRLLKGLPQILAFALLGMVLATACFFAFTPFQKSDTSTRVTFAFPGYEKGENPDKSKFQPEDVFAPANIADALRRLNLDSSSEVQGKIRSALVINAIVPPNVAKERDRLRASGQTPAPYIPDEYTVTLTLPRGFSLTPQQRIALLHEIISCYRANFQRTYGSLPIAFGGAFAALKNADYPEYQIILDREIENLSSYLALLSSPQASNSQTQQAGSAPQVAQAASFRSPTTNFSFKDLLEQTQLFAQIRVTETLGLIRENGLSRNRKSALVKLDYYIRTLEDQERWAVEDEKVVRSLLDQSQAKARSYVLGIKSEAVQQRTENAPLVDKGLIDSLLANDADNFLVRKALDAGMKVRRIQAEKAQVSALRESIQEFMKSDAADQTELIAQVQKSLQELEVSYNELISNIRRTFADFAQQQYGSAVRITDQTSNPSIVRALVMPLGIGFFLGFALGAGLSLLEVYVGRNRRSDN